MLIASGVSAIVAAALLLLRRRRLGGRRAAAEYERAIQSGRLPDGADPGEWASVLDDGERFARRTRVLVAVLGALTVVLGAIGAAVNPDLRVLGIVLAVAFAAVTVIGLVRTAHHLRRVRRLRGEVRAA